MRCPDTEADCRPNIRPDDGAGARDIGGTLLLCLDTTHGKVLGGRCELLVAAHLCL